MVEYGYYNSLYGDRTYTAELFNPLLDAMISDGVYKGVGDEFHVSVTSGMEINVGTGRAWFNASWIDNDEPIAFTIDECDMNRIDIVYLEFNKGDRMNTIGVLVGDAGYNPSPPTLIHDDNVHQYPLAHISVQADTISLAQENIFNTVGVVGTPYAGGGVLGRERRIFIPACDFEFAPDDGANLEHHSGLGYLYLFSGLDPAEPDVKFISKVGYTPDMIPGTKLTLDMLLMSTPETIQPGDLAYISWEVQVRSVDDGTTWDNNPPIYFNSDLSLCFPFPGVPSIDFIAPLGSFTLNQTGYNPLLKTPGCLAISVAYRQQAECSHYLLDVRAYGLRIGYHAGV